LTISPLFVAAVLRLQAEGQQILAKYALGCVRAPVLAAAAFPEPDEVKARYQTDIDRAAALPVLAEFRRGNQRGDGLPPLSCGFV
jgi:hypothetical protein